MGEKELEKHKKFIIASNIASAFLEGYAKGLEESSNLTTGKAMAWLLGNPPQPKSRVLAEYMEKNDI